MVISSISFVHEKDTSAACCSIAHSPHVGNNDTFTLDFSREWLQPFQQCSATSSVSLSEAVWQLWQANLSFDVSRLLDLSCRLWVLGGGDGGGAFTMTEGTID